MIMMLLDRDLRLVLAQRVKAGTVVEVSARGTMMRGAEERSLLEHKDRGIGQTHILDNNKD